MTAGESIGETIREPALVLDRSPGVTFHHLLKCKCWRKGRIGFGAGFPRGLRPSASFRPRLQRDSRVLPRALP